MAFDIVDMFYKTSGYTSDSAYADSDNYVPVSDVTGSYIPIAEIFFEKVIDKAITISSNTTGDIFDDKIIAELAALTADFQMQNLMINPDTGEPENRHWQIANLYMLQGYGIMTKDGTTILPGHSETKQAMKDMVRVVNILDDVNLTT